MDNGIVSLIVHTLTLRAESETTLFILQYY